MPLSVFDFEQFSAPSEQDNTRWDLFQSTIVNVRFNVPVGLTVTLGSEDVGNLPGLAAKYLGSRYLWYVLLHYNGLYDPLEDTYAGMTLNIPQLAPLLAYLKRETNGLGSSAAGSSSGDTSQIVI